MNSATDQGEQPGEAFIPYRRGDLLSLCLEDGRLTPEEQEQFRHFSNILAAFTHFDFHHEIEEMKSAYWEFDPDLETIPCQDPEGGAGSTAKAYRIYELFRSIADRANYQEISLKELEDSFLDSTLIDLSTDVDLDDFHKVICFGRGSTTTTKTASKAFRKVEVEASQWRRVLILIHFKEEVHFITDKDRKKGTSPNLPFTPGKIYAYSYKDVPKADLELLFPNVRVSMTPKDKLLLSVPAVGAGIAAIIKVGAKILLLLAALAIALRLDWVIDYFNLPSDGSTDTYKLLTAALMVLVMLSLFGFKQWDKYKNKRNSFLKMVSENLFFRNLATNQAVFSRMLDSAEEEECKEAMLVYYHLLANRDHALTAAELDQAIEHWMQEKFGTVINFDIDGPIANLQRIIGKNRAGEEAPLLRTTPFGHLSTPPLPDACHILDYLWDTAYQFNENGDDPVSDARDT